MTPAKTLYAGERLPLLTLAGRLGLPAESLRYHTRVRGRSIEAAVEFLLRKQA